MIGINGLRFGSLSLRLRMTSLAIRGAATVTLASLASLASGAVSETPPVTHSADQMSEKQSKTELKTITVEAQRERAALEHQVSAFVSAIAVEPFADSLARWQEPTAICPSVAGMPREHGEFMLARLSRIAESAGAPLAPEPCKPNLHVVVTSEPEAVIKAFSKREPGMYGDGDGSKIRKFESESDPVRVWYNTQLYDDSGKPLVLAQGSENKRNDWARASRLELSTVRCLTSIIVIIDARRVKGVTFGQLADYVAMVALAEIRVNANIGNAPSILRVFSASGSPPPAGLSAWDQAFLKALYHTRHTDKAQLAAIKTSVLQEVAP
jgi:hypothetical protein